MTHDEKIVEAVATAEVRYDGYEDLLCLSRTMRERYLDRARAAITAYQAEARQPKYVMTASATDLTAIEATLAEPGHLVPVRGWQPIETAPKNGDAVFLWGYLESSPQARPHIGSEERFEAYWDGEAEGWRSVDYEGWVVSPSFWHPTPPNPPASP